VDECTGVMVATGCTAREDLGEARALQLGRVPAPCAAAGLAHTGGAGLVFVRTQLLVGGVVEVRATEGLHSR
jgi:hypothetical protein